MNTPEKERLPEGKSPSDGCGECEIDYIRHGAREMQAFQTKENNDLRTELAAQALQIAGLLASNKEWGEKYETIEKEMLDYKNLLLEVIGDVTVDDWTHRITRVIKKYLPTPTDKP